MSETFDSLVPTISFFKVQTHIVEFDPSVETIEVSGTRENGDTWSRKAIPVRENNVKVLLGLSKDLTLKLKQLGPGKKTVKITRSGSGFDTAYEVQVVQIQTKVNK